MSGPRAQIEVLGHCGLSDCGGYSTLVNIIRSQCNLDPPLGQKNFGRLRAQISQTSSLVC